VVKDMDERLIDTDLRKAVEFHGHLCPGLATGYRVAKVGFMEICGRTANGKTICKECFQRMISQARSSSWPDNPKNDLLDHWSISKPRCLQRNVFKKNLNNQ
jgi:hypothetical protein